MGTFLLNPTTEFDYATGIQSIIIEPDYTTSTFCRYTESPQHSNTATPKRRNTDQPRVTVWVLTDACWGGRTEEKSGTCGSDLQQTCGTACLLLHTSTHASTHAREHGRESVAGWEGLAPDVDTIYADAAAVDIVEPARNLVCLRRDELGLLTVCSGLLAASLVTALLTAMLSVFSLGTNLVCSEPSNFYKWYALCLLTQHG